METFLGGLKNEMLFVFEKQHDSSALSLRRSQRGISTEKQMDASRQVQGSIHEGHWLNGLIEWCPVFQGSIQ